MEPTPTHVILLALNVLVRDESKPLILQMFAEQRIKDPQAYEKVTLIAADLLQDATKA